METSSTPATARADPGPLARASRIAVVVPCYRERARILDVLERIGPEVAWIFVVDDACPEHTGELVQADCHDPRVRVLRNASNQGVGGATLEGYAAALAAGAEVIVKLDGDGQMDPGLIPRLVRPILEGQADYTKGNRFFELEGVRTMPGLRLFGNTILSFVTKLSSGYWDLFDPTNGFTAIQARVAERVPLERVSRGFFFESDLLFRLNTLQAVVRDVPMRASYGSEASKLAVHRVAGLFLVSHARNTLKRIVYNYFLRNFTIASIEIVLGLVLLAFGVTIGVVEWLRSAATGIPATSGTVMLAALPVLVGIQLLIAFIGHDMHGIPREPLHKRLL